MKKYITGIVWMIPFIILASCSEDKGREFVGADAFITSLVLEKGGDTYQAVIKEKELTVSLPVGVSLHEGVKAVMEWSENATVLPDPAGITNWNEEILFVVTAYDGTRNSYTYNPEYTSAQVQGDVVLTTQAEVVALAERYPEVIRGNLIIGSDTGSNEDPVTDLSPLSTLTEVTYYIIVKPSFAGTGLRGLQNIRKAGGVRIQTTGVEIVEFRNLLSVQLDVEIVSEDVQTVSFPVLESIGENLTIKADNLDEFSLLSLASVGGTLQLNGCNKLESFSFPALNFVKNDLQLSNLASVTGFEFPVLKEAGSIYLSGLSAVEAFDFPGLERLCVTFQVEDCNKLQSIRFSALKEIGCLSIEYSIQTLMGFELPSLTHVHGTFSFATNAYRMLEVVDFPLLEKVAGDMVLTLSNSQQLKDIRLPLLKTIEGSLQVGIFVGRTKNTSLTSIDVSSLQAVEDIWVRNAGSLNSFDGFRSVIPYLTAAQWTIEGCGYNPTYTDMVEGR